MLPPSTVSSVNNCGCPFFLHQDTLFQEHQFAGAAAQAACSGGDEEEEGRRDVAGHRVGAATQRGEE
ncbi:unnamed protein product [Victoria cruziana]